MSFAIETLIFWSIMLFFAAWFGGALLYDRAWHAGFACARDTAPAALPSSPPAQDRET